MNIKKQLAITILVIFTIFAFNSPTLAGSPQQHRWEGVAIGIGAVVLGKALFDACHRPYAPTAPRPAVAAYHHYYQEPAPEPAGHWETRKHWVPPVFKKVWNPGHYNRHGHWVPGRWLQVKVESGYWVKKKVWVPHY